jgi:hypothetical protein
MAIVIAGIDLSPVSLLVLSSCWIEQAMTLTKPLGSLYTASTCLTICQFSIANCSFFFCFRRFQFDWQHHRSRQFCFIQLL